MHYGAQGVGGEIFLKNLNLVIAKNLKSIRVSRKLSLDKVANLTGVSKSMLGQIERGETNPTVTTVWKIANGLKISFTALIKEEKPSIHIVSKEDVGSIIGDNHRYRVYPIFPFDEEKRFEIYTIELESGAILKAEGHGGGTEEYINVFNGELTLTVGSDKYVIGEGGAIRFNANKKHIYENKNDQLTVLSMIIYYPPIGS